MTDYFDPPATDVETGDALGVAGWVLWTASALFVIASCIFLGIQLATPSYERLLAGFGTNLPTATRIAVAAGNLALLFAVVHALPLIRLWRSRRSPRARVGRDFGLVIFGFVVALVAVAAWGVSMYLPIFQLGAVT